MSRKTASFSQLINYLNNGRVEKDDYSFRYNVYSHKPDFITKEYLENYKNLKKRKNGNAILHEVISLKHQNNLSIKEQREMLKDLAEQYTNTRAKNNLVYGVIHEQKNQVHCHLMISSNELTSEKNKRLSKKEFEEVKANLKNYAYTKYPTLEKEKTNRKARAKTRKIDNEVQLKKRTGKKSDKEIMKERLQAIFTKSNSPQSFISTLEAAKIRVYQRGKTFGFLDEATNKKYRLKTLELEREFETMDNGFMKLNNSNSKQGNDNKQGFDKAETEEQRKFREQMSEIREAQKDRKMNKNYFTKS